MPLTIGAALRQAAQHLLDSPTPLLDARVLLCHLLDLTHADIIAREDEVLGPDKIQAFTGLVERRAAGEPVAYILGTQEFFGRAFCVTPDVLIPRPETEMIVERALALGPRRVLDLGTGSGCIVLSILAECPSAQGEAWDLSSAALAVAQCNAQALGLTERIAFRHRRFEAATEDEFDLIVSNPPYIEAQAELPSSVVEHEPHLALFAGEDGLDAYRHLAATFAQMMQPATRALLEIGKDQGEAVAAIFAKALPERPIEVHSDLAGLDRMVEIGILDAPVA